MTKAVVLSEYRSPDVLIPGEVEVGLPRPGQIRVNVEFAGVGPDGPQIAGRLQAVMALVAAGQLTLRAQTVAPLADAAQVHRDLESGAVRNKVLLSVRA